jgi:hypothetical protein
VRSDTVRRKPITRATAVLAIIALGPISLAGPALAQTAKEVRAGVAAAIAGVVRRVSFRTPRAKIGRLVASGDPIYLGDRIVTGNKGRLQILLQDRTTFTIGSNAAIVIDKFVYDPKTSKGKLSARILKGAFRFVSGRIAAQNPSNVKLKLPSAVIGIRGTIVLGIADGTRSVVVLEGVGPENNIGQAKSTITVTAGGQTVTIYRTGWGIVIQGPNTPPGTPIRFGADAINAILKFLGENLDALGIDPSTVPPFTVEPPRGPISGLTALLTLIQDIQNTLNRTPEAAPPPPPPPPPPGDYFGVEG